MTANAFLQLALLLAGVLLLTKPLGWYIAQIADGKNAWLNQYGSGLETFLYRISGVNPQHEMNWKQYAFAVLAFNLLGFLSIYLLQRWQAVLPLNPQHLPNVSADSAFNTAVSFITNTNWQDYSGETTQSYLTQMLGLAVQNFFSAATALAVLFAMIRGFSRHSTTTIGNFWIDLTRGILYILLPLTLLLALALMSQGVIQNFNHYPVIHTLSGQTQTLPMGPVASQEAIKEMGTNGGGFFNANSAHPFENPTPLSNFLEMLSILLIPAALCYAFGRMIGDTRQGWTLFTAMLIVFICLAVLAVYAEQHGNPWLTKAGADQAVSALQSGGNMEGKETRFGVTASALFAVVATATSCGAVNAMHDSFTAFGGLIPLWLMQLGEIIFGGVGSGLYGMLIFAILAVFVAGLMIGRTPEYLGKKIESYEIKMTSIIILITPFLILVGAAIAVSFKAGRLGIFNPGTHGFSEILYALSSTANNNGSAFEGLSANTPFYNILLGIVMWFGRFWTIIPVLAIAGSLAKKKKLASSAGSLPTHGFLFILVLMASLILVAALTFFPSLALGPIAEGLSHSL